MNKSLIVLWWSRSITEGILAGKLIWNDGECKSLNSTIPHSPSQRESVHNLLRPVDLLNQGWEGNWTVFVSFYCNVHSKTQCEGEMHASVYVGHSDCKPARMWICFNFFFFLCKFPRNRENRVNLSVCTCIVITLWTCMYYTVQEFSTH